MPIFKLGLSGCGILERRLEALGRDRYGGSYLVGNELIVEPGFDCWDLQEIIADPNQSPLVEVGHRHLAFNLPDGMTLDDFDREFREAFSDLSLSSIASGQKLGKDEARRFERLTCYSIGSSTRISPAIELNCVKTRVEGDEIVRRIVALLERLNKKLPHQTVFQPQARMSLPFDRVEGGLQDVVLPTPAATLQTARVSTASGASADIRVQPMDPAKSFWRRLLVRLRKHFFSHPTVPAKRRQPPHLV